MVFAVDKVHLHYLPLAKLVLEATLNRFFFFLRVAIQQLQMPFLVYEALYSCLFGEIIVATNYRCMTKSEEVLCYTCELSVVYFFFSPVYKVEIFRSFVIVTMALVSSSFTSQS